MYSVVLMAALTTGTDLPDWGRRGGCHGCYGCWGGCYGGWGGGCYGGWGGGCYGGWGGGYGGYGRGGWGGGYGGYGWGGWGGGWGGYVYAPTFTGYAPPMIASNTSPYTNNGTRSMYYNPDTSNGNRATIIVHVPESATLTVDGQQTTSTSATRRFSSSTLEPGKTYHYNFEARMDRDGKAVRANRRVDFAAGDQKEITFNPSDFNPSSSRQSDLPPEDRSGAPNR
jgi:uncharacterized protein (TIGR03000 family)